jgi:hypothetical protein
MSTVNETAESLRLQQELGAIELDVTTNYTLADAIREGSTVTEHEQSGWGDGLKACALTAAVISARARNYL